jgi:hypothetical protein
MTAAQGGATGSEVWTLIVYVDDDPQERQFPTEQAARHEANRLELAGWEEGIAHTMRRDDHRRLASPHLLRAASWSRRAGRGEARFRRRCRG